MSAVVLHFPRLCSRACLKRGWMINVYKSQLSLQWKSHTLTLPLCWKPPQLLLLLPSESCVRFSLKHFRPKSLVPSALWPSRAPPLPPPAGLDCGRRREECSDSSHSHLVCLLSSPCCVAHDEPGSHLLYFAVSWVAPFCCFKTGDVFMSLIWVPLTKVTSSHVGTVCWLRVTDRQISLSVWCYLHVTRAGNEHQPVNADETWLGLEPAIHCGRIMSPEIPIRSTYISKRSLILVKKCEISAWSATVAGGQSSFPVLHVITVGFCFHTV